MKNSSNNIHKIINKWESGFPGGEVAVKVKKAPTAAKVLPYPQWLDNRVIGALTTMGVSQPYSHQVQSWEYLHTKKSILVATPTASGKTFCYNIPVADALCKRPGAKALYLFPTKALARDQEASVRHLLELTGVDAKAVVYDGDTPASVRQYAKREAGIIITNPDMLHTGILPHHSGWMHFFANLELVVVDELHQYRGIFGAHVANVIRRLVRIAKFYNANPTFAACSATIGNPGELAENVLGCKVKTIKQSGAPTGEKNFVVFNPPVVDEATGTRASALKVAARMAYHLIQKDITTLVFCQTRRGVEVVLHYLKNKMKHGNLDVERVRGYRGGYLPLLRREIETLLREGKLDGVVATNALELGIDVGGLDAVVLAGYPGTIAAFHQRGGRAGRRQEPSLCAMVARGSALDQFIVRNPDFLLEASPEHALVAPDNVDILLSHLKCAVFELPFKTDEKFASLSLEDTHSILNYLSEERYVSKSGSGYHFISSEYPAAAISLRNGSGNNVVVYDKTTDEPIANVPPHSARFELFEQAIYQHDSNTFQVEHFDIDAAKAYVTPIKPVYYTVAVDSTQIDIIEQRESETFNSTLFCFGDVQVTENMTGYKKIKFGSHENLGYGDINLPPLELDTEAAWFVLSKNIWTEFDTELLALALEGVEAVLAQVASLRLMCDPRDLVVKASSQIDEDDEYPAVTIFLYDAHGGGAGIAERGYERMQLLLSDALILIRGCECTDGCPACVGPISTPRSNAKKVTITLLNMILHRS